MEVMFVQRRTTGGHVPAPSRTAGSRLASITAG